MGKYVSYHFNACTDSAWCAKDIAIYESITATTIAILADLVFCAQMLEQLKLLHQIGISSRVCAFVYCVAILYIHNNLTHFCDVGSTWLSY